jgi:hypothetical protein
MLWRFCWGNYKIERNMSTADLIREIITTYKRHGWNLRRALLRLETKDQIADSSENLVSDSQINDSTFDALWFSRPSHSGAEAWELRLVADTPYALFERVGKDVASDERSKLLKEMEERLREYAGGGKKDEG